MNRHQRRAKAALTRKSLDRKGDYIEVYLLVDEKTEEGFPIKLRTVPVEYEAKVGDEIIVMLWNKKTIRLEQTT
jgi:hypothetical protein